MLAWPGCRRRCCCCWHAAGTLPLQPSCRCPKLPQGSALLVPLSSSPPPPPPPFPPPSRPRQVLPKREGLLHISEWSSTRVEVMAKEVKEGDLVDVMVTEVQVRVLPAALQPAAGAAGGAHRTALQHTPLLWGWLDGGIGPACPAAVRGSGLEGR